MWAEMYEEAQLVVRRFVRAMDAAEANIVGLMAREREALRAGDPNAARSIHNRLGRALSAMSDLFSDSEVSEFLEQRRITFASLLRIEMAALTAARLLAKQGDKAKARIA